MSTKARELGEFGLIQQITRWIGSHPRLEVGIGDDAAVIRPTAGKRLVATIDSMVAGVHFHMRPQHAYDIGRKALAVNLSDLAAMGARPLFALVSLVVSDDVTARFVDDLYRGLADEAAESQTAIAGGDVVSGPHDFSIHLALVGEASPDAVALRRGARVGDLIGVTHHLGASAAGLAVLESPELAAPEWAKEEVVRRHLCPRARLEAGQELAAGMVTAMIDLSDGLAGDLRHICRASGVGAVIYAQRIPISQATRLVAAAAGKDPLEWALTGGEDYELLFTAPPTGWQTRERLPRSGTPVTVIGEIVEPEEGIQLVDASGRPVPLTRTGFTHF